MLVTMPAGPGDGCPGAPRIRWVPAALESPTAVDVGLRAIADGTRAGHTRPWLRRLPGLRDRHGPTERGVPFPLAAPLGARVLLGQIGLDDTEVLSVDPE